MAHSRFGVISETEVRKQILETSANVDESSDIKQKRALPISARSLWQREPPRIRGNGGRADQRSPIISTIVNQEEQLRPCPLDLLDPFTVQHGPLAWLETLHLFQTGSREETRVAARTPRCRRSIHQSPKLGVAIRILQEGQPRCVGQRHTVAATLSESGHPRLPPVFLCL